MDLVLGFFDRAFDVKPREFLRVHAFFLFLTTVSIFYTMGASVGDTLFLSRFGSKEAERLLPWVYVGTGLVTIALTWLYEQAEERLPRARFLICVELALAASLLGFRWALRSGQPWLFFALVIWLEACALVALMLFFSFAGDYFTTRDARRLYGYVNGGIAVGSITGGWLVDALALRLGDENLLYICAALMGLGALWCLAISFAAAPVEEEEEPGEEDERAGPPLRALFSNRFLQIVVVVVVVSQVCCWLVDYQLKIAASAAMREEALAVFFGRFYGVLGVVQLFVQLFVVGWLLRRFGVVRGLFVLPALLLFSNLAFLAHPVFAAAVAGNFVRLTLLETLDEPAQELLFLPLPARLRVRAQSFVEGMVLPLGISAAGLFLLALSRWFPGARLISVAGAGLSAAWIAGVALLLPRYRDMLAASLRGRRLESADLSRALAGADGARAVAELLRSPNAENQLLALDLSEGRPLDELRERVVELSKSLDEAVAVRAVRRLAALPEGASVVGLETALADARDEVRAAAVAARFELAPARAAEEAGRWLGDAAPAVRAQALLGCMRRGALPGGGSAVEGLSRMIAERETRERRAVARALARSDRRGSEALLDRLLADPAVEVRREIVAAAAAAPRVALVGWLAEQLRERGLRSLACAALEAMPLGAVPAFIELIAERGRPLEDRVLLTRVLGRFGGLRGAKVLWEILGSEEDILLRTAAAETLLLMRARDPAHDLSRYEDDGFVAERLRAIDVMARARAEAGAGCFLSQVLHDQARLELRTVLATASLMSGQRRVDDVETSLFQGTRTQKANALELVDALYPRETAAPITASAAFLVEEPAGSALTPQTARALMDGQAWIRAAVRHHARQAGLELEGVTMTGHEAYLLKLMTRLSVLKSAKAFEGVSANHLASLAKVAEERTFCRGEVLFSEGRSPDAFYLVCEGALQLTVGQAAVSRLGPGDCAGEMALIEGQPYSATASALDDARVLRVSAENFESVLLTHSEITLALLRHVSARLRAAQRQGASLNAPGSAA